MSKIDEMRERFRRPQPETPLHKRLDMSGLEFDRWITGCDPNAFEFVLESASRVDLDLMASALERLIAEHQAACERRKAMYSKQDTLTDRLLMRLRNTTLEKIDRWQARLDQVKERIDDR